ncbi:MAG TPA: porin, partial [Gemmatimonadales bacterium]|nr:porin [Gemmatimonadales bacterium]
WLVGTPMRRVLTPILAVIAAAPVARAQAPVIRMNGRAQVQYRASWGGASPSYNTAAVNNGFEIRRLRIQADVQLDENIFLVIQPSLEMASLRMRDAYVRVSLSPAVGVTLGQEKAPFYRYEFNSSNNLPSIERGLRMYGLAGREGLNDLVVNNGYAAQDLGAFVDLSAWEKRLFFKVGVVNGSRESSLDVNNAKSFFGRVALTARVNGAGQSALQFGASVAARDRAVCAVCAGTVTYFPDSSKMTTALGLDLEIGGHRPGFHLIADAVQGDNVPLATRVNSGRNTGNLPNTADSNVVTFRGVSLIGAYRLVTAGSARRVIRMVEPALRLDWADPNSSAPNDAGVLVTPAASLYFGPTTILRVGLDLYRYGSLPGLAHVAREFKVSWQANF